MCVYTVFIDYAVGVGAHGGVGMCEAPDEQGEGYTIAAGALGDISDVLYKNHGWSLGGDCEVVRRIQGHWWGPTPLWLCTLYLSPGPTYPVAMPVPSVFWVGKGKVGLLGSLPLGWEARKSLGSMGGISWPRDPLAIDLCSFAAGRHSERKLFFFPPSMCLFSGVCSKRVLGPHH